MSILKIRFRIFSISIRIHNQFNRFTLRFIIAIYSDLLPRAGGGGRVRETNPDTVSWARVEGRGKNPSEGKKPSRAGKVYCFHKSSFAANIADTPHNSP